MVDPDDKLANVAEDKDIVRPDKNANKNFISKCITYPLCIMPHLHSGPGNESHQSKAGRSRFAF